VSRPYNGNVVVNYDRTAAAAYALRHAIVYNPSWRDFGWASGGGGDCTNFVSQCLYAGGWPMVDAGHPLMGAADPNSWFAHPGDTSDQSHTRTWTIVEDFFYFLLRSGRARRCMPEDLRIGDVVQLRYSGDGVDRKYHSMIVSMLLPAAPGSLPWSPWATVNPGLSYHSNDTLMKPLDIIASRNADNLICWSLNDSFVERRRIVRP
jgi:hypothetical protein